MKRQSEENIPKFQNLSENDSKINRFRSNTSMNSLNSLEFKEFNRNPTLNTLNTLNTLKSEAISVTKENSGSQVIEQSPKPSKTRVGLTEQLMRMIGLGGCVNDCCNTVRGSILED